MSVWSAVLPLGVAVGSIALLARSVEPQGRSWTAVGSLLLGHEDEDDALDLRFWVCTAAVAVLVATALAFRSSMLGLGVGQKVFGLALSLPILAGLIALATDGLACLWSRQRAKAEAPEQERLSELLDEAGSEVLLARSQVEDSGRLAALEALGEAITEYSDALAGGPTDALEDRIRGVIALAKTCLDREGRNAARTLGVRPGASQAELSAVYDALSRVYSGESPLPGVDLSRQGELDAAYQQLRADKGGGISRAA